QSFILDQQAKALGLRDGAEYVATAQQLLRSSQEAQAQSIIMDFCAAAPEFPGTPEAQQSLWRVIEQKGLAPNAESMKLAHSYCLRYGLYEPLTAEQIQQTNIFTPRPPRHSGPTPPPMISGTQPEMVGQNNDAWTIPLDKLRERVLEQQQRR